MAKKKKPHGRPRIYSPKLAAEICRRLMSGQSLRRICRDEKMPHFSTVMQWLSHPEISVEFEPKYKFAREVQIELMGEQIIDIADDSSEDYIEKEREDGSVYEAVNREHIQRSRLRVDTRKWIMAKQLPKKYGDKVDVTSGGKPIKGNTITFTSFKGEGGNLDDGAKGQ